MASRPTEKPAWTQGNPGVQVEPNGTEKNNGWLLNMPPPLEWMNWLFGNVSDWIDWFDYNDQNYNKQNLLLNGAFDFFQYGNLIAVTHASSTYVADRWFIKNISGGTVNGLKGSGSPYALSSTRGANNACALQFTGSSTSNAAFLTQVISNANSLPAYNNTVSLGFWVLGLNNTNQIIASIGYASSETKTQATIASQSFTVNGSTWTYCQLNNVAVGTSMTTSGTLSVTLEPTGAATGNAWDLNNGFLVTNVQLNIGQYPSPFRRSCLTKEAELLACQSYFEKSFALTTAPANNVGQANMSNVTGMYYSVTGFNSSQVFFKAPKRVTPSMTYYNPDTSVAGNWSYISTSGAYTHNEPVSDYVVGTNAFSVTGSGLATSSIGASLVVAGHWSASAEI